MWHFSETKRAKAVFIVNPSRLGTDAQRREPVRELKRCRFFGEFEMKTLPHSVVFALSNDESITALPVTIPHRERALGFLKRGDAGALASRRSFRSRRACRLRKPRTSDQTP
jgi:hypothetical protein